MENNNPESNQQFFYKGKFFQNEDEFYKYVREWMSSITDEETFFREWHELGKNVWLNIEMMDAEISNGVLGEILYQALIDILENVRSITRNVYHVKFENGASIHCVDDEKIRGVVDGTE